MAALDRYYHLEASQAAIISNSSSVTLATAACILCDRPLVRLPSWMSFICLTRYFCQNTTRGFVKRNFLPAADETLGGSTGELIEGVEYTTTGVTAIADFQSKGYTYIKP